MRQTFVYICTLLVLVVPCIGACSTEETEGFVVVSVPSESTVELRTTDDYFEKGVQVFWHSQGTDDVVLSAAQRVTDYVKSLGADSIGITIPVYADSIEATTVYTGVDTPTPERLAMIIDEAVARGLKVHVRLLIDDASLKTTVSPNAWRGDLVPIEPEQWFSQYSDLVASYVPMLIDRNVREYVIGVELKGLQSYPALWEEIGERVKQMGYTGTVSYTFNWSDWTPGMPFDSTGIDAYPNVDLPDEATVEQLTQSLSSWFATLDPSVLRDVTLQEVGIAALSGNYWHPWKWGDEVTVSEELNLDLQAKWFTAMCQTARAIDARGIFYWMVDSDDTAMLSPEVASNAPPKSFIGRPAEESIRRCFTES